MIGADARVRTHAVAGWGENAKVGGNENTNMLVATGIAGPKVEEDEAEAAWAITTKWKERDWQECQPA